MNSTDDIYRKLQQHLDEMPVPFPATKSGVELRLLKQLFTPAQARIALALDYKFKTAKQLFDSNPDVGMSLQELEAALEEMVDRGNTFAKEKEGVSVYANMPLAVGMWELQVSRLTPELLRDADEYFKGEYGHAFHSTKVPQVRIVPVQKSIRAEHRIGTYDELRRIIEDSDEQIRVGECLCRKTRAIAGHSCKVTARQETCMAFRDFGDLMGRMGWGRPVSKEEALQIAAKNEEDGLVLEAGNEQETQFICSCCGDCCGVLRGFKALPRPVDYVATNYSVQVEEYLCNGCGVCVDRCQMGAMSLQYDIATLKTERCIGCGLCVTTCPAECIHLIKNPQEKVPPKDMDALFESIMESKNPR